jgi:hypothetical protein
MKSLLVGIIEKIKAVAQTDYRKLKERVLSSHFKFVDLDPD